jgi:hypothetical protein
MSTEKFSDVQVTNFRPEVPPGVIDDAWSSAFDAKPWTGAKVSEPPDPNYVFDFSTGDDLYPPTGERNQFAAAQGESLFVGPNDGQNAPDDGIFSADTLRLVQDIYANLRTGDTQALQSYIKNLHDAKATNPALAQDLQRGLDGLFGFLGKHGINASSSALRGSYTIDLPSEDGVPNALTIFQNGDTDLKGAALADFQNDLSDYVSPKPEEPDDLSDLLTNRLIDIDDGIFKNDLTALADTIKDIADRIHSVAPGDDGIVDRQIAADLQDVLDTLASEWRTDDVTAGYDRDSGSFTITQTNAQGGKDTLIVDKFGRPSLSGQHLQDFLTQLNVNLSKEPKVRV